MAVFDDYASWQLIAIAAYFLTLLLLSVYGTHRFIIVRLFQAHRQDDPSPAAHFDDHKLPTITVQLPIFNERYVVERLINAACALDYPRDRLQIQVLDDSTDDTTERARMLIQEWRDRGVDIALLHRHNRQGFKAGALAEGLHSARGDFVAIFDADFIPRPDFLRQTIHHFIDDTIGMVQARWSYINRDYSLLTRAQAVLLDGHFILEHTARHRSGRFFNFNGTAGIWRRQTIDDAGGWEHDTLTEDLDLSYRAQLKGWSFRYLKDLTVPSELPVSMTAFKSQQHRWSKGALQTALKLLPTVFRSKQPLAVKIEAFYHLTGNLAYVLMVILALLMPLATLIRIQQGWYEVLFIDLPIFFAATVSICYFYWTSQRAQGRRPLQILALLPAVLALGIGLCLNNAKGVLGAALGHDSPFVRTPKYAIDRLDGSWASKLYKHRPSLMPVLEFAFGAWFSYAIWVVLTDPGQPLGSLPFLLLFQLGFLYVSLVSIGQTFSRGNAASPST